MKLISYAFWLVVIILGIIFASLNSHSVIIDYYFNKVNVYFPLLMLIELAIGALLGVIAMLPALFRAKGNARKHKQRVKEAEQEVKNLREIPLKDNR